MSGVDGQAAIKRHAAPARDLLSHRKNMHTLFPLANFSLAKRTILALALLLLTGPAFAQEPAQPPTLEERVAKVESSVGDAALAGHNAWMLTSSALVLFMTAPGLAMFYSGLLRKKNVLSVMMQFLFLMGLLTVVGGLDGYSFGFRGWKSGSSSCEEWG